MAENNSNLANFENLVTAIAEDSTEKMQTAVDDLNNCFITAENGTEETLKKQYDTWSKELDRVKRLVNVKGSGVTQEQVKQAELMVSRSKSELDKLGVVYDNAMSDTLQRVSSYASHLASAGANLGDSFISSMANAIEAQRQRVIAAVDSITSHVASVQIPSTSLNTNINSPSELVAYTKVGHAKGGIVTREHIARVGEDGAEAIIPLERNTEWIDRVAERMGSSGDSSQVVSKLEELNENIKGLKIYLDSKTLVGGLISDIDTALGSMTRLKRRGAR